MWSTGEWFISGWKSNNFLSERKFFQLHVQCSTSTWEIIYCSESSIKPLAAVTALVIDRISLIYLSDTATLLS